MQCLNKQCVTVLILFMIYFRVSTAGSLFPKKPKNGSLQNNTAFIDRKEPKSLKVFGGNFATPGMFPFMVHINQLYKDAYLTCGGTLISDRWVMTSAHCVRTDKEYSTPTTTLEESLTLGFGDINRLTFRKTDPGYVAPTYGYTIGVESVKIHPQSQRGNSAHDICLLMTSTPVQFSNYIYPSKLANRGFEHFNFEGTIARSIGWGLFSTLPKLSDELRFTDLLIGNQESCGLSWYDTKNGEILCTLSSPTTDMCSGDSGSPLFVYTKDDSGQVSPVVIGIVSNGPNFCPTNTRTIYTPVTSNLQWIEDVTGLQFN